MRLLVYLWASALRSESASINCNHITLILTVLLWWHCLPRALAAPMCGQSLDPASRSSADDNHWRQLIETRKFHYWGLPPRERRSDWNQADTSQLTVTLDVATGTVIAVAVVCFPWHFHTRPQWDSALERRLCFLDILTSVRFKDRRVCNTLRIQLSISFVILQY